MDVLRTQSNTNVQRMRFVTFDSDENLEDMQKKLMTKNY